MPLRWRLTIIYTTLVGGILLLFGVVVYALVSVTLINQLDEILTQTVNDLVEVSHVNELGELSVITLPSMDLTANVYIQIWNRENKLSISSPNISRLENSLDPIGLQTKLPIYRDSRIGKAHLRVVSVPLQVDGRKVGVVQVGASMALIDATQQALFIVLILTAIAAMTIAGCAGYLSTSQSLAPLQTVTETALQITRADDLSRRIPYPVDQTDEVGQLIHAFNQTLSRMEGLFNAQRRFMADVSHELRTPLTVIKGNVSLLRKMGRPDEESLSNIENEVDRLTRLVGDLLLLAQAESGKLSLDLQPVELDTVLLEVYQQMRLLAGDRLKLRLREIDQVIVQGDRDRLKQVLLNLIGNAIKYTPSGGVIDLSLSKVGEQARLIVSDNGPGIPPQDLPYIFDRFFRAEKSRTRSRSDSSFGLGLSIANWIVRNHKGRIEVNSREGEGTTFCVWLPTIKDF
jgi:signal transduction histidine kinase